MAKVREAIEARQARIRTHEDYIKDVVGYAINRVRKDSRFERLARAKVVYGVGEGGARGVTRYGSWTNGQVDDLIEVCASCEEGVAQLFGTSVHEAAHVLAGYGAGHGSEWKAAARLLGLSDPEAAGQVYSEESFDDDARATFKKLAAPADGTPSLITRRGLPYTPRPCSAARGVRGGKSQGPGSGSRLRLWECECSPKPVKVRVASDDFKAHCDTCGKAFHQAAKVEAPAEPAK